MNIEYEVTEKIVITVPISCKQEAYDFCDKHGFQWIARGPKGFMGTESYDQSFHQVVAIRRRDHNIRKS